MKLENKVAIVTGAATGIGQAIAIGMAREGASVVIDYVGGPDAPAETLMASWTFLSTMPASSTSTPSPSFRWTNGTRSSRST